MRRYLKFSENPIIFRSLDLQGVNAVGGTSSTGWRLLTTGRRHGLPILPDLLHRGCAMTGQPAAPAEFWWLRKADAGGAGFEGAWHLATDLGVTVSVVDRGVNHGHADLAAAYDVTRDIDPRDAA